MSFATGGFGFERRTGMTREEIKTFRTGDGFYELRFSEAEMSDAFNGGSLDAIESVLKIIDKWEKHLSNYTDGIYVQGQKMMLAHIRCDVLILKGGEQE